MYDVGVGVVFTSLKQHLEPNNRNACVHVLNVPA